MRKLISLKAANLSDRLPQEVTDRLICSVNTKRWKTIFKALQ